MLIGNNTNMDGIILKFYKSVYSKMIVTSLMSSLLLLPFLSCESPTTAEPEPEIDPVFQIVSPNNGEMYAIPSTVNLIYSANFDGAKDGVVIEYSTNNGVTWAGAGLRPAKSGTQTDTFVWVPGDSLIRADFRGKNVIARVRDKSGKYSKLSGEFYFVELEILAPVAGQTCRVTDTLLIIYRADFGKMGGASSGLDFEYSLDDGLQWVVFGEKESKSGLDADTFKWFLSDPEEGYDIQQFINKPVSIRISDYQDNFEDFSETFSFIE